MLLLFWLSAVALGQDVNLPYVGAGDGASSSNLVLQSATAGTIEVSEAHLHSCPLFRRRFGLLSEVYWFVRALGPITGCRGSHGGSGGGRSERYPRADRNLAPTPFAESGRCR